MPKIRGWQRFAAAFGGERRNRLQGMAPRVCRTMPSVFFPSLSTKLEPRSRNLCTGSSARESRPGSVYAPRKTLSLDAKTNEMVNFLFSFRGIRIAPEYINGHVIPLLCAKANIPLRDAMSKITAHRARATIASALYNAPEGLGIGELGQWLGHKDMRSTQYYAKLHPTRLAKSISRANKNSRLAQVLVDPSAAAKGEPAIFYYLGDGDYCANPAWASCPHRMACLKCPMYVPQTTGKLIEARQGILRLLAEVPLSDEEKAVAEGDVSALNRYIQKRSNVSAPEVPDNHYVFSPLTEVACTADCSLPRGR
jgi:hypothetical protein